MFRLRSKRNHLPQDEQAKLAALAQAGDRHAEAMLLTTNLGICYQVTLRHVPEHHHEFDDCLQVAMLGLVRAIHGYRPDRGMVPSSYFFMVVNHAVLGFIKYRDAQEKRSASRLTSLDAKREGGVSFADSLAAPEQPDEVEAADLRQRDQETVAKLLGTLDERRRDVVCRRFGLNGHEPHTLDEIATAYAVSRERARQLVAQALDAMRDRVIPLLDGGVFLNLETAAPDEEGFDFNGEGSFGDGLSGAQDAPGRDAMDRADLTPALAV